MREINKFELLEILTCNRSSRADFALEIESTIGGRGSIFKFKEAFSADFCSCKKKPEFMAVFSDGELDGELSISLNVLCDEFAEACAAKIKSIIKGNKSEVKFIIHTDSIKSSITPITPINKFGDLNLDLNTQNLFHSFYFDQNIDSNIVSESTPAITIRMLDEHDRVLCNAFKDDDDCNDDYFAEIFDYSIKEPKYKDCGIIGGFDEDKNFIGYISYYGLDETTRDVSYIYVGKKYRKMSYAKMLLNFFKNKNIGDKKISYYSYPENEYSAKLAESCGFLPCAYRYECIK